MFKNSSRLASLTLPLGESADVQLRLAMVWRDHVGSKWSHVNFASAAISTTYTGRARFKLLI